MADRGRAALPVDNRLCNDRWVERCQRIHRDKLRKMKSTAHDPRLTTLDNTMPVTLRMQHLHLKQKKAQLEEERFAQIELENNVLLEKMTKIMKQNPMRARSALGGRHISQFPFRSTLQLKPGVRVDKCHYPVLDTRNYHEPKSLNRELRQRELKRIMAENHAMLTRIRCREPFYDHKKWEEERKRDLQYLNNIKSREVMSISQRFKRLPPLPHQTMRAGTAPAGTIASPARGGPDEEEPPKTAPPADEAGAGEGEA